MGHVPGAGAGPVPGGRPRPPGDRRDPVRRVPPQPPHHDGSHGPHHHLDTSQLYQVNMGVRLLLFCTKLSTYTIITFEGIKKVVQKY